MVYGGREKERAGKSKKKLIESGERLQREIVLKKNKKKKKNSPKKCLKRA